MCWLLFGTAYSALEFSNPWRVAHGCLFLLYQQLFSKTDPQVLDASIYEVLKRDSIRLIMNTSTGSFLGKIIIAAIIDYVLWTNFLFWPSLFVRHRRWLSLQSLSGEFPVLEDYRLYSRSDTVESRQVLYSPSLSCKR